MTTTHSCLRVRLVTRHWPAANNSFSKSWDQAETEIINPLSCQTKRTLRNWDHSLLLQPRTEQLGMVSSMLITCTNMFYHFYNLFQLNKLESLSLEAIKCGPLINNFSIHIGKTVYYKTAFLLHCKIHSKSVLIPGKFREKSMNFEKHASQNFLDPT